MKTWQPEPPTQDELARVGRADLVLALRKIRDHAKGLSHAMRHTVSRAASEIEAIDKPRAALATARGEQR